MDAHRNVAVGAMQASNLFLQGGFMKQALGKDMPEPIVPATSSLPGALPAMAHDVVPAETLHMLVDIEMVFTIADWDGTYDCSAYYDPSSPWYNVFYGAYGLRSYKPDGTAWGFFPDGSVDFDEFVKVPTIDYDFLTAGMFGCPPSQMCFRVNGTPTVLTPRNGWNGFAVNATIPSGLHNPLVSLADPMTYVIYGIPDPSFIGNGHTQYEPVQMVGQLWLKQIPTKPGAQPISLGWGALCPSANPQGTALLASIVETMGQAYFPI